MAVRTQETKVLQAVVEPVAVHVVDLKGDRFAEPLTGVLARAALVGHALCLQGASQSRVAASSASGRLDDRHAVRLEAGPGRGRIGGPTGEVARVQLLPVDCCTDSSMVSRVGGESQASHDFGEAGRDLHVHDERIQGNFLARG
jgi:hypothetical protein